MKPYADSTQISADDVERQPLDLSPATLPTAKQHFPLIKVHGLDEESAKPDRQWATGIRLAAKTNAVILLVIVALTIAGACYGHQYNQGLFAMYEGDCKHTKAVSTGLHVLINILSITLVATSSYCCQLLMAPTRENVDHAHARRIWIPIGTFDLKQLSLLPWRSKAVCYLLFATSIAIQLMYVFSFFFVAGSLLALR